MVFVGTMSTKLMFVLALALGASACVTEDEEPVPTDPSGEPESPLPQDEYPDDPTCGANAAKGDGACLPD